MSRISKHGQFLESAYEMKHFAILTAAIICLVDLCGCETTSFAPPPVTVELMRTRARARQHVEIATLREGRVLFVSRCIECHTLPAISRYKASQWPSIIDEMTGRANLKPAERDAVLAYILAARAQ
jgi:hypothetical protein